MDEAETTDGCQKTEDVKLNKSAKLPNNICIGLIMAVEHFTVGVGGVMFGVF